MVKESGIVGQIERIEQITDKVYQRYNKYQECVEFKEYIDSIPTYTLFSREMTERLHSNIYQTSLKQDRILSMLMDIVLTLKVDGLNITIFRKNVLGEYRQCVNSSFLSKVLRKLIEPKDSLEEDNILLGVYLLKNIKKRE